MIKLKQFLDKNKIEFYEDFDIGIMSTIKLSQKARLVVFPKSEDLFVKVLNYLFVSKIKYRVFGNLSNVLFCGYCEDIIVSTQKMSEEIKISRGVVSVSAGMSLPKFCEIVRKNSLAGVEGLINIPATIGGAIRNNAGAYGYSISDRLIKIKVFYEGSVFDIFKNEIKFGYHYSNLSGFVILEATFLFENKNEYDIIKLSNEVTYLRGKTQPLGLSLGSVFKKVNDRSAGFYIERSGLKGLREGGIVVSSKHSNFFVNDKNGSAIDFLRLLSKVQSLVQSQFAVCLVPEIEKVGGIDETCCRPSHTFKI